MYLYATVEGDDLKKEAMACLPLGPGFTEKQVSEAKKMEVWVSSFNGLGNDFTLFELRDANGAMVAGRRVDRR